MPKRLTPRGEAAPPVEPIVTGARIPPKEPDSPARKPRATSGAKYVRNLHHIKARVTLTTGREIMLEPRGQRDDIDIVNRAEQQDPRFFANRDLIFEVLEPAEAEAIIAKQQTNSRQQGNTLWDHLRNAGGKPYEQREATMEQVFEDQGVVVGKIEETGGGRFTDKNFTVTRTAGPQFVDAPGSPGHPATNYMQSVPGDISPEEYHEFLLWKQFREAKTQQTHEAPSGATGEEPKGN